MSDEIRRAHDVGNAVRRQMGKIPSAKNKKKKAEEEVPYADVNYWQGKGRIDKIGKRIKPEVVEGEEVPRTPKGAIGNHGEIYEGEEVRKPKQVTGGKKSLPRPAPKAIEPPPTGPFVAERLIDLNPGPNFGGDVYRITKAKPRQFRDY